MIIRNALRVNNIYPYRYKMAAIAAFRASTVAVMPHFAAFLTQTTFAT